MRDLGRPTSMLVGASNLAGEIAMAEETRRVNVKRAPSTERETGSDELSDQVTNDSLGTTDTADSTGLDTDSARDQESDKMNRSNP